MKNTHLSRLYKNQFGLMADLYHLTMAYGYWKNGRAEQASVFQLFYRKAPFEGTYVVTAGLALVIDYLDNFRFTVDDIQYLGSLKGNDGQPLFEIAFLNYLQRLEFRCDIDAMPEGTIGLPHQPIIRVQGPLLQAQIIESALLNLVNFSSLIATKAARIVQAADGDPVLEFGLRRAQGIDGALTASRAAFIGGCAATSNLMAGQFYRIPVKGTHAHSWVMSYEDELEAFRAYADAQPNNSILLIDTFDTLEGLEKAIIVAKELNAKGHQLAGIRLDSGDLVELSKKVRQRLNEAGLKGVKIVASDSLDEYQITQFKAKGAAIDIWGVGTRLITAKESPALGGVYKLAALQDEKGSWKDKIKLSEVAIKTSDPGILQVNRIFNTENKPLADIIYDVRDGLPQEISGIDGTKQAFPEKESKRQDLLIPIYKKGKRVYESPTLQHIKNFSLEQQHQFKNIQSVHYPAGWSPRLYERKQELILALRNL